MVRRNRKRWLVLEGVLESEQVPQLMDNRQPIKRTAASVRAVHREIRNVQPEVAGLGAVPLRATVDISQSSTRAVNVAQANRRHRLGRVGSEWDFHEVDVGNRLVVSHDIPDHSPLGGSKRCRLISFGVIRAVVNR